MAETNNTKPKWKLKYLKYARARVEGKSQREAAIAAGYKPSSAEIAGCRLDKRPEIQRHIKKLLTMQDEKAIASRDDILSTMTQLMKSEEVEPKDRIGAASQIAKLQGYFAPKKTEHKEEGEYRFIFEKKDGSAPRITEGEVVEEDTKQLPDEESEDEGMIEDAELIDDDDEQGEEKREEAEESEPEPSDDDVDMDEIADLELDEDA